MIWLESITWILPKITPCHSSIATDYGVNFWAMTASNIQYIQQCGYGVCVCGVSPW